MIDYRVSSTGRRYALFARHGDNGIIGYGRTIEEAFEGAAAAMFALIAEPSHVRALRTIPLSFKEPDAGPALVRWLDLLLKNASREGLVFSEFAVEREGALWRGCAAGQPWSEARHLLEEKMALTKLASVSQRVAWWRACCTLKPQPAPQRRKTDHFAGASH